MTKNFTDNFAYIKEDTLNTIKVLQKAWRMVQEQVKTQAELNNALWDKALKDIWQNKMHCKVHPHSVCKFFVDILEAVKVYFSRMFDVLGHVIGRML